MLGSNGAEAHEGLTSVTDTFTSTEQRCLPQHQRKFQTQSESIHLISLSLPSLTRLVSIPLGLSSCHLPAQLYGAKPLMVKMVYDLFFYPVVKISV